MRVIDSLPYVLEALRTQGITGQTDLTVMTWGTSGKGAPKLTKSLFPSMVSQGLMKIVKVPGRRGTLFQITEKGEAALDLAPLDPEDREWFLKTIEDNRADGEIL